VRFGVSLVGSQTAALVDLAVNAERLGFDSVWLGEHVIVPRRFASRYPYSNLGDDQPALADMPFYDPYAALSFLAARTTTLLLGLSVAIVPLHDPYHLARSVATVDLFSGGRFLWGIGTGWLAEEFEILGRTWHDRGSRLEEALDLIVHLWNDPAPSYSGRFFTLPPAGMEPKPLTRPHPPFVFGGTSPIAIRRAARLGDGWLGVGLEPASAAAVARQLRELRTALGKADDRFDVTIALSETPSREDVAGLDAAGVDRIVLRPARTERDVVAALSALGRQFGVGEKGPR
jgi:probable F420-dependent oxidoreductase